jgi:hypothetical protein
MNSTPVPCRRCSSSISFRICLRGDVERGGGLVGDQQHRFEHQRHRDHDALALAARQLVRVAGHHALGVGQQHLLDDGAHLGAALGGDSLVCSRSTSSIWSPQVMTGFSAVIGSWKIIDMRVHAARAGGTAARA